jgi:hypothetical protein
VKTIERLLPELTYGSSIAGVCLRIAKSGAPGRGHSELHDVPSIERQGFHGLGINHLADGGSFSREQRRGRADSHTLLDGPESELDVKTRFPRDLKDEPLVMAR